MLDAGQAEIEPEMGTDGTSEAWVAPSAEALAAGGDPPPVFAAYLNLSERGGVAPNGKDSYTLDEAAAALTRKGFSWGVKGQPFTLTYGFRATEPTTLPTDVGGFSRFNSAQIVHAELALQAWADVSGLTFVRAGSGSTGEAAYSDSAVILFANYSTGKEGVGAFAYLPAGSDKLDFASSSGDVWVNVSLSYNAAPTVGNYGLYSLTHELGHALGLSHPADYRASSGNPTYGADAIYFEDSRQYTLMSYFDESFTGASFASSTYAAAPLLDDIAAIQLLYGPNMATRTGDTTYGFNATAGRAWFEATSTSSVLVFAAWDAGGSDTFDFSGYSAAQVIDLRQGAFSDVGGWRGNVAIARGTDIEHAIGGSGADSLVGNNLANRLDGGLGNDSLNGGQGADTLSGGPGDDRYTIDHSGDQVIETSGGGRDTLVIAQSTAGGSLTLADTLEDGVLAGGVAFTLRGNAQANALYGDAADNWLDGGLGNDTLRGIGGADTLTGGAGDDFYYVDGEAMRITEAAGEGADTVFLLFRPLSGSWTLPDNIETALAGSAGAYLLNGNAANNRLYGDIGADSLAGGGGADTVLGAKGNDWADGGDGNDLLGENTDAGGDDTYWGGAGDDYIADVAGSNYLRGGDGNDAINGGTGFDDINGNMGADTLHGNDGEDWVVGGKDNDLIFGDAAFDIVYGNMGNDTVDGGTGADWVRGGQGDDSVMSGAGDDWLWGDRGNDTISGGAGADLFYSFSGAGIDRITDFSYAEGDRLKLEGSPSRTVTQVGLDVIVDMGNGDQVILVGVSLASLGSGWII